MPEIESAGFKQITIVDERSFPAYYVYGDPIAQMLINGSGIPRAYFKKLANSIRSISVRAVKPWR